MAQPAMRESVSEQTGSRAAAAVVAGMAIVCSARYW